MQHRDSYRTKRQSRAPRASACASLLLCVLLFAGKSHADTASSLGNRSGEGSTPFTALVQAPEANLFTGTLNTSIPIQLPPGRKGMTPKLALAYSSSAGPGPYGYGWELPLGRIERSTRDGVPRPCDGEPEAQRFALVLPGAAAELVFAGPGDAGTRIYRARIEEAWIEAVLDPAQNRWTVYDRSGTRFELGWSREARFGTDPDSFARSETDTFGHVQCSFTSAWALTGVEDPNGNRVDVSYYGPESFTAPLLPRRVEYGANPAAGLAQHLFRVDLDFEPCPDPVVSYRLGARATTDARIARITVRTLVPEARAVRSYQFTYAEDGRSLLTGVSVLGSDGSLLYPPQTFSYSARFPSHVTTTAVAPPDVDELRRTHRTGEVQQTLLDMNGDGFVDLVRADNGDPATWTVFPGGPAASANFSAPVELFDSAHPIRWHLPAEIRDLAQDIRNVLVDCSGGGGASCARSDVFDLTGDGIPDFVDARPRGADGVAIWRVYPGTAGAGDGSSWGFSATRIDWPAPYFFLNETLNQDPQVSVRDLVDMNADGRPDLVRARWDERLDGCFSGYFFSCPPPLEPRALWEVYYNRGSGFDLEPTLIYAPRYVLRAQVSEGDDTGSTLLELADVNGDGLPDLVEGQAPDQLRDYACPESGSCLVAFLNTGDGFEFDPTILARRADRQMRYVRYSNKSGNGPVLSEIYRDFFDVNGDGLPDWVFHETDRQGPRRALLNNGSALTEEIVVGPWAAPIRMEEDADSLTELFDINGDGVQDFLDARTSTWTVALSTTSARPDLLTAIDNGMGGRAEIYYRPSTLYDNTGGDGVPDLPFTVWTVAALRLSDGECRPPDGADPLREQENPCIAAGHESVSLFAYEDGRYDPDRREMRGFRAVYARALDGDPAVPDNSTLSIFGQEEATAGRLMESHTFAGDSAEVAGKLNFWQARPHPHDPERTQVFLGWSIEYQTDIDAPQPHATLRVNHDVDPWGNVLHSSFGSVSGEDRVDTYTTYATPRPGSHVHDRPSRARSTTRGPSGDQVVLSEQVFLYDGGATPLPEGEVERGNVRVVRRWHDRATHPDPETHTDYDAFGNVEVTTDAAGKTATLVYDPYHLYPVQSIDHLGHVESRTFDYRCGKAIEERDASQQGTAFATRSVYDDACRPVCEALPGEAPGSCTVEYEYAFREAPEHSYVLRRTREPNRTSPSPGEKPGYLPSWQFYDALGRPRGTETYRSVGGAERRIRFDEVDYDGLGRVRRRYEPHAAETPPDAATLYDYRLNGGPFEDPLGRVHEVTRPDGSAVQSYYRGASAEQVDELGVRTISTRDARGNVVRVEVRAPDGTRLSLTEHGYDGAGRLIWTQYEGDPATRSTVTYDSLGRVIERADPDSGRWQSRYDVAGNLVWQNDPEPGQSIFYCYDDLHRLVRRIPLPTDDYLGGVCSAAGAPAPGEVRYTYDVLPDEPGEPFRTGRLVREESDTGETVYWYDERGRVRQLRRVVKAEGETTTATFAWEYDSAGRPVVVQYPDGERVVTLYDSTGQAVRMEREDGTQVYVASASYDLRGNPMRLETGNGVVETEERYGPEERHRLHRFRVERPGAVLMALRYDAYTPRGRLARLTDEHNAGGGLSRSAAYSYDLLGRLVSVAGPNVNETYAYDVLGNLRRKGLLALRYDDPSRPHQPTSSCQCADEACRTMVACQPIEHDLNGNRTRRHGAVYSFDAFDRLVAVSIDGVTERYLYGSGKDRVAVVRPDGSALRVFNELAEVDSDGYLQKYYFFGGRRIATTRVWWTGQQLAAGTGPLSPALAGLRPGSMAALAALVVWAALLAAPSKVTRRSAGVRVRDGHTVAVVVAFLFTASGFPAVIPARTSFSAPWSAAPAFGSVTSTSTLEPVADTEVLSALQLPCTSDNVYGVYDQARVGRRSGSKSFSIHNALLRFDLSQIPPGATIVAADLTLEVAEVVNSNQHRYRLAPLTQSDWKETEATWKARHCSVLWSQPGGDFEPALAVSFSGPTKTGPFVLSQLAGLVQRALDSGAGRVEWHLGAEDTTSNNSWVFHTREAGAGRRPVLRVTWTPPPPAEGPFYYHLDHLGSVVLVTGPDGAVEREIRRAPYGGVDAAWDSAGRELPAADPRLRHGFNGYEDEPFTGLQYAGTRYYDPELGLFLTHDPAGQFRSPYAFTGWDPVNRTDPSGAFVPELIGAALVIAKWALISAGVGAYTGVMFASVRGVNGGSAMAAAAARGAVSGAIGVGMGVVASGVTIGLAAWAGSLPENVTLQHALNALGEVARRSAFSSAVSDTAGQTAATAGAPGWAVTLTSLAAGYGASVWYDKSVLNPSGNPAGGESKGDVQRVSNTRTHTNTTYEAAREAGYSHEEAVAITKANLSRDADVPLLYNMDHFDFKAQRAFSDFNEAAGDAVKAGLRPDFLKAIGQASHHLQDQYALGHILPGTHLIGSKKFLAAAPLALVRGFVHQTAGGEVTFWEAQYEATLNFFEGRWI